MIPDILLQGDPCGSIFLFIVIVSIVVHFLNSVSKATRGGAGGGSLFGGGTTGSNVFSQFEQSFKSGQFTGGTPFKPSPLSPQDFAALSTIPKKRPPINWNVVKLNLTKDQIQECFDMAALSKGVRKEDLPRYVYLDRLRKYFSDAQLADMIDVAFFDSGAARAARTMPGVSAKLGAITTTIAGQKKSFLDKLIPEKLAGLGGVAPEGVFEEKVAEPVDSTVVDEERRARELMDEQLVIEEINRIAHADPVFSSIIMKLDPAERKNLSLSLKNLVDTTSSSKAQVGGVINGIIWSEILKRRTPGSGKRSGPFAMRR